MFSKEFNLSILWKKLNTINILIIFVGNNEDKMVRVPKDMYDAIGDIIKKYPQYGWKGPSEFVRDAIRRYVEELKRREILLERAVKVMPNRVKVILSKFMGPAEAEEAYEKIMGIQEKEPEEYIMEVVNILSDYVGEKLAELIARRIVEERENEGEHGY